MKNCLLLLALLLLSSLLPAQTRLNEETARQTAQSFVKTRQGLRGTELRLVSASNIYVYNIDNQGFIIVSGNTVLPPILAWSNQGTFPSLEEAPEHFVWWIQHYRDMIEYAEKQGLKPEFEVQRQWDEALAGRFPSRSTASVDPLISTRWDQGCYYNEYCPEGHGGWWGGGPCGHVYTGCVATAMAQVMKYWNHPTQGFGSHTYTHSEYGVQSANFGATTYQWNQMPVELWNHNDAVATLMYHCGVSVNMDYGTSGSGAQSSAVETAARSYFGYCGAKYREKRNYSEEDWIALLKNDLDQGHPLYYSGTSSSVGHAFVCDGYDNNNLFHFNFGWSGSGDSYYSLYDVNGYQNNQAAVFNMVPMDIRADENGIIYVSADGQGNGASWDNATHYLEYATLLSSGGNTQVWVKQGTYYGDTTDVENAFYITGSNKIYGSFNGDEAPDFDLSQRDFVNHATILDGQGVRRVLNQADLGNASSMALWDGFVLQNGLSGSGSGAYLNGFVTLSNCIIRNNQTNAFGGGVYINSNGNNNEVNLIHCKITGNSASMGGGVCDRSNSNLTNCVISNNTAVTKGGGLYLYNSATTQLKGCLISNNSATNGGGLYARGKAQLHNCTMVMNEATTSCGGAFHENPQTQYQSCILWGNWAQGQANQYEGRCQFSYCAVQGGAEGTDNIDLPDTNTGEEPGVFVRFEQPAQGAGAAFTEASWKTESRSICLNRGKPGTAAYATDLNGHQRVQGGRLDIGAYESDATLTLIEAEIAEGQTYWFNGRPLQEPGYYTAAYPTAVGDSVVGLTLQRTLSLDETPLEAQAILSVEIYTLLGQHLLTLPSLEALETAPLKTGCYLLQIHCKEGVLHRKTLINR
ncbi:MAG: C10 family peptidase [Bacteroidales bacterium]|nr:C10 family peptidase [Bacteroidales bacterium]